MPTLVLALVLLLSIGVGAGLRVVDGSPVSSWLVATAIALGAWSWMAFTTATADAGTRRPKSPQSRAELAFVASLLILVGLARGLSVETPPRIVERGTTAIPGPTAALRELEVVGASEPGPRCRVELRDPRAPGASLAVSAPPSRCPELVHGRRVAVSARALSESWEADLTGTTTVDLGLDAVLWLRPSPDPVGIERVRVAYWRWVGRTRQRAWAASRGDPRASLAVAVGLGLRSALAPDQREQLRAAGLGHLIAVSGLHVAVAAIGLQALARRAVTLFGGDPRWACVIAWLPLWGYVGLTGAAASAVRAALMLTGLDLATLSRRPSHGPTLLAVAAAGMLLVEPRWCFDPGFGLSVAAMAAIVTAPTGHGVLATSWRITWATAPMTVLWFDAAPLHGVVANAVALPLFGVLMPIALLAWLGPEPLAGLARPAADLLAAPILDLAAVLGELPAAGPGALVGLAGLALAIHRRRGGRRELGVGEPPPPSAWLPPRLACALSLVVGLALVADDALARARAQPVTFDWIALGSPRAASVVVGDPSRPASACWVRPAGSPRVWLALFEAVGVRRLSGVELDGTDPRSSTIDPGRARLLDQLDAAGIEVAGERGCSGPDPAQVRAALRGCRARQGGYGRALARSRAGRVDCRIVDRWVAAPELARTRPDP